MTALVVLAVVSLFILVLCLCEYVLMAFERLRPGFLDRLDQRLFGTDS